MRSADRPRTPPAHLAGGGIRPRFSRRALLGAGGLSLLLSGCVVETPVRGPVPPTRTIVGPDAVPPVPGQADRWRGRDLRVVTAGDDIGDALRAVVFEPFANATGCRVDIGFTDYGSLLAGGDGVDLALVEERWAVELSAMGTLSPVDAVGLDGTVPDLFPASGASVPAFADAIVSTYRLDAAEITSLPADWSDWWQSGALPGNRTLAKGPFGTFEFALLADGVPPDDLYPLDLERAIAGLRRISGSIVDRWWESGPQAIDWLSGGRAAFGSALAHQVVMAQRLGRPIEAIWNEGLVYADQWVIPVNSENDDIARDLIGFALSAPVQAALAIAAGLAPVSSAAVGLVDPALRPNLASAPVNLPRLVRLDAGWWAANVTLANQAFTGWLLGDPRGRD